MPCSQNEHSGDARAFRRLRRESVSTPVMALPPQKGSVADSDNGARRRNERSRVHRLATNTDSKPHGEQHNAAYVAIACDKA